MTSPPNIGSRRRSPTIVALYERLVRNGQLRRHTALAWLRRHFPDDAKNHLERIVPHSEQWFSIGDRVEPAPHEIARSLFPCGEIGRASCRARVCPYVWISWVAGFLKK